jgi:ABC-type bacteriocin/lantibiotic exporter with double-glycine peptidase domain
VTEADSKKFDDISNANCDGNLAGRMALFATTVGQKLTVGSKYVEAGVKPVVQLEQTGCGIAAVAMLAGVSYREMQRVANRLGIFADDSTLWSDTGYVRRLLKEFGIRAANTEVPFTSWEALPGLALLAIKWHKEEDRAFWHWVVFSREAYGAVVLDSKRGLRKHKRTDFGRMRPVWCIPVDLK